MKLKKLLYESDYRGQHRAPSKRDGAPLHDVTVNGIYPEDIYTPNGLRYYGSGGSGESEAWHIITRFKDKPDARIKVYRAVPKIPTKNERIAEIEKYMKYYLKYNRLPTNFHHDIPRGERPYDWLSDELERLKKDKTPDNKPLQITRGDWVTTVRGYAVEHAQSMFTHAQYGDRYMMGKYQILSKTVTASQIFTEGNSMLEWGYDP